VSLPAVGTWEFSFSRFALEDQFGARFVYEAGAFGKICFLLICDDRGLLEEIADVNSNDFPLTWATRSDSTTFEITRAVPEPAASLIFGAGLAGLFRLRVRRRRTRQT